MRDKEKQKISAKKHYELNKEKVKARAYQQTKIAVDRNKVFISEYLKTHPCVDCEENDIIVLEFDHVRGIKFGDISKMVRQGYSIKKLIEEIDKCDVRCANCHRRKTYYRRKGIQGDGEVRPRSDEPSNP